MTYLKHKGPRAPASTRFHPLRGVKTKFELKPSAKLHDAHANYGDDGHAFGLSFVAKPKEGVDDDQGAPAKDHADDGLLVMGWTVKDNFVAYYRVSTERQGRSGLGLEAQQKAVQAYLNGGERSLIAELTEIETGKPGDRPE